ncbi:hypothetical protein D3C81_1143840 [compost metagenome]
MGLGSHVQRRGGLVEYDQLWPQDERQRQHYPLLLPARQLMREPPQEGVVIEQPHIQQGLADALAHRFTRQRRLVCQEGFTQQSPQAQRRVQRRGRVLGHVADQPATGQAQGLAFEFEQRLPGHHHLPAHNARALPGMAQQRRGQGGLARAGLAHQANNFACRNAERHLGQHIDLPGQLYPQVADLQHFTCHIQQRAHGCFSPILALARPIPSARMLVP